MPVQNPPFSGAKITTTSYQTLYENTNFGVHEGYIVFEAIAPGDAFEITINTYNTYRASLSPLRIFPITYAQLSNGAEPSLHIMPRQTTYFQLKIKRTAGSDRTISYTFFIITPS